MLCRETRVQLPVYCFFSLSDVDRDVNRFVEKFKAVLSYAFLTRKVTIYLLVEHMFLKL
jgi:hypothetical protein